MSLPNLRGIFRSSRTEAQEYELRRNAWLRLLGFAISCIAIVLVANRASVLRRLQQARLGTA
ncbi:hypothetical protein MVES1_000331 [Malassezia vespertilionis]|uniref:Uncharacterized protein n=1 Tax=Malassezia vespertilionis TaxID=2020962 RepID=A0A2N1JFL2_9BASI|nr:uncharacterized protein MVES1_000331 [Malassezia vespertilionis]PKI85328.1 hypothetical protein MVES_000311 [Malassezia vespertilionis]WFD05006.1 hypothetical protein MVES1_000331 [Malassezia vespertilionis]